MEKFWHKNYPSNIPKEIKVKNHSIYAEFEEHTKTFGSKTAFENFEQKISFNDWRTLSSDFASYLQNHCHLKKGDRIAIQIPNLLQSPIVIMGALQAGLVVVNINPLYTAREMKEILKDAQVQAIVIFSHSAHNLEQIISNIPIPNIIVTDLGDLFSNFKRFLFFFITHYIKKMVPPFKLPASISLRKALKIGSNYTFKKVPIQKEDYAFLQYTGGTTGSPKGAILTQNNILSNLTQCRAWMVPYLKRGKEISITALPFYHIFALTINLLLLPFYGAHSILITNPRDVKNFISLLRKNKTWSIFVGVNSLFKLLLNQKQFHTLNFNSLQYCIAGGASVEKSVFDRWLKTTQVPLVEGYGLTEASPVISCNILNQPLSGTCGLPLPSTHVRIVDDQGHVLGPGQVGELQTQGPQVMKGYWNHHEETKNVLDSQGWLKTGDIAQIDKKGYIKILDRKKDMILVSGFNVYPNEIENILSLHPKIKNSAVIGVKDEHSAEVPKAFIVKKDPLLTKEEVISYCKKNLVAYKIPKHIEFKETLPHSHVGKVLRRELKN